LTPDATRLTSDQARLIRDLANAVAGLPGIEIFAAAWVLIVLSLLFGDDEDEEDRRAP
jgi:hypothetical protein